MKKMIKDKGATKRTVSPKLVAKAMSAEETGVKIDARRGPIALFALREFFIDRLYSTGGRPRLMGTRKVRSKITFFDDDWKKLKEISKYYIKDGINVTSSQIASALIHRELSKIKPSRTKLNLHV